MNSKNVALAYLPLDETAARSASELSDLLGTPAVKVSEAKPKNEHWLFAVLRERWESQTGWIPAIAEETLDQLRKLGSIDTVCIVSSDRNVFDNEPVMESFRQTVRRMGMKVELLGAR